MDLLMSPGGRTDPYPLYHRLRELSPVHRSRPGFWLLSRYADCDAVLADSRFTKDYTRHNDTRIGPDWREHVSLTEVARSMLNIDGAEHARLRGLAARSFTRRAIEAMRPKIVQVVDDLVDRLAEAGGGDVPEALSFPLALGVISEMLGVPPEDLAPFPELVRDIVLVFEAQPTAAQLAVADRSHVKLREYFQDLVAAKRRAPGSDLLSALVTADDSGDRLTDEELWLLGMLLLGAGFDTSANQIGNGLLALLRHPAELARVRADESLLPGLPDELMRYDGTAQINVRVATAPAEVGGEIIPAGATVLVLLGAGNRDPARYPEPDRVDVTRTHVRPLTLGGGPHYCLGAALARVEIEAVFRALMRRFSDIEIVEEPLFRDRGTLRGLEHLRVACRAA